MRICQWLLVLASLCLGFLISHLGLHESLQGTSSLQFGFKPQRVVTLFGGPSCNCSTSFLPDAGDSVSKDTSVTCSCPPTASREPRKLVCSSNQTQQNVNKDIEHHEEAWYAHDRPWHFPVRFPRCSMDVCFNYTKCEDQHELLIFSYDIPTTPVRFFSGINSTRWHTSDPLQACLFFVFLDLNSPYHPDIRKLPYWENGMNHVLITFADKWSQKGPPQDSIGNASVMASGMHETIHRPGFDISIPLPGNHHLREFQALPPFHRKYFLTFRGLRYLGVSGVGVLRSHDTFRGMHNGEDIIVATSCHHFINDLKRAAHPEWGGHCDEDDKSYGQYSFHDLMNTTFGLVPAGVQPNSYRFIEVISAGVVPVLIADNYVKPFDTLIQWHRCVLQFPSSQMHRVVPTLRELAVEEVEARQSYCLQVYNEYLKDRDALLSAAISSLKARFMGMFPIRKGTV